PRNAAPRANAARRTGVALPLRASKERIGYEELRLHPSAPAPLPAQSGGPAMLQPGTSGACSEGESSAEARQSVIFVSAIAPPLRNSVSEPPLRSKHVV